MVLGRHRDSRIGDNANRQYHFVTVLDPVQKKAFFVVSMEGPLPKPFFSDDTPSRRLAYQRCIPGWIAGDHLRGFATALLSIEYSLRDYSIDLQDQDFLRAQTGPHKFNWFRQFSRAQGFKEEVLYPI